MLHAMTDGLAKIVPYAKGDMSCNMSIRLKKNNTKTRYKEMKERICTVLSGVYKIVTIAMVCAKLKNYNEEIFYIEKGVGNV
jgi:hypothetical protein